MDEKIMNEYLTKLGSIYFIVVTSGINRYRFAFLYEESNTSSPPRPPLPAPEPIRDRGVDQKENRSNMNY